VSAGGPANGVGLHLRRVGPADDAGVRELIHTVMPEFGAVGPGFALSDAEVDAMAGAYAAPRHLYLVLVDDRGRVVGGGGYAPLGAAPPDVAELRKMYLLRSVRGHGHGRRLLGALLEAAARDGYARIYLETMSTMTRARAVYERAGFVQLDGPWGDTGHDGCDAFYAMELEGVSPTTP